MKALCCTLALMTLLCLTSSASLAAQSLTAGPEIQVWSNDFIFNDGTIPALAAGPDGGFLSSWLDNGALNLRAFSPADTPLALMRQLSPRSAQPSSARLAALGPDRFVAVWARGSLRGQILDAAGAPAGPQLVLADGAIEFALSAEPTGGFVVAWMNAESSTPYNFYIKVRRFDAHGAPASAIFLATSAGLSPAIAALPDGGFAVAWVHGQPGNPAPTYDLRARAFRADGTPAGPETVFPESAGDTWAARIAADATGRWVVAWAEFPTPSYSYLVKAWRFSPTGQPLDSPIVVAAPEESGFWAAVGSVAMRPDGSFLVSWGNVSAVSGGPSHVPYDGPAGGDVRARMFDAAGVPLGPDFLVHSSTEGQQHVGEAAATADGWIVSWKRRSDPQSGIYARRFTLSCGTGEGLCLNGGRFRAEVVWHVSPSGPEGEGQPVPLTGDTGAFWFFSPANLELIVKVLDGTAVNGHFWVFYGSLTDVQFDLTVTDTATGQQRTYHNPAGTLASRADTQAFP